MCRCDPRPFFVVVTSPPLVNVESKCCRNFDQPHVSKQPRASVKCLGVEKTNIGPGAGLISHIVAFETAGRSSIADVVGKGPLAWWHLNARGKLQGPGGWIANR